MKKFLAIVLGLAIFSGCATVGPAMRQHPRCYESQAKDMVAKMANAWEREHTDATALHLEQEAVWISPREVMIRASWGPANHRRMANFIFNTDEPMALKKTEGDKPF